MPEKPKQYVLMIRPKDVEEELLVDDVDAAADILSACGWEIVSVDDSEVMDRCEACGHVILESERYARDDDGIYLCSKCCDDGDDDEE